MPYFGSPRVMTSPSPGTAGYVLTTNSTGSAPSWTSAASLGTNYFQLNSGALSPANITNDLLLGGTSTTSAKFAFTNDIGSGTPTASISANSGNNATYLTGAGVLGTTNGQTLTLGSASTGNVVLVSGGTTALTALASGKVGIGTTAPGSTLQVSGTTSLGYVNSLGAFGVKDGSSRTIFSVDTQTQAVG